MGGGRCTSPSISTVIGVLLLSLRSPLPADGGGGLRSTGMRVPPYDVVLAERDGRRDGSPLESDKERKRLLVYRDLIHRGFAEKTIRYLGEPQSDGEWNRLRRQGLIPILEAHAAAVFARSYRRETRVAASLPTL
ncbi:hypothetical protein C8Q80DRAFT_1201869 [Daedaleopsis nitida]|nr:hypothetical protein C8Q80DRAFT_1201869 [Daedaleopsis nitida]